MKARESSRVLPGDVFAVATVGTASEDPKHLCFPESEYMNVFAKTVLRLIA
jgi:hypothetical protein